MHVSANSCTDVEFQLERGILKCPGAILVNEGLSREVRFWVVPKLPSTGTCLMTELFEGGNGG